jgi:hypothetical protein
MKQILILGALILGTNMLIASEWIPADDPGIQYFGRWDTADPAHPAHSWPGVYIVLNFTGTSIGVRMTDDVNYYNVDVDGKFHGVFHGDEPGEADYWLADSLDAGPHTLRLSKRNIAFGRIFSLAGFLLDDGAKLLPPPPAPKRKIEFLGDSFTAAEGNEAAEPEMEWTAKMPVTNIDQGFAAVIARHFDAEYTATCRSGIGLVNDWQGHRDINLPSRFDWTLMESDQPKWDFSRWIPDLVVICLGLNDYSGFGGWTGSVSDENTELFRTTCHAFLDRIRNVYPGVKIMAVAPHVDWIRQQVHQVVDEETAEGNRDAWYAQFDYFDGGYVANGHPTVDTHHKMADQIITAIEAAEIFAK